MNNPVIDKKILFLCTFLGKTGGIPIFEEVLVKNAPKDNNYILSNVKNDFKGKQFLLTGNILKNLGLIKKIVRDNKIDLIFYNYHTFPLFLISRTYTIRIFDMEFAGKKLSLNFIMTMLNSLFAKKILVSSNSTKIKLQAFFRKIGLGFIGKRISRLYLPLDPNFLELVKKYDLGKIKNFYQGKNFFLIVSSEYHDFLLSGVREINKRLGEDFKVVITGKIADKEKKKINEKYGKMVIFAGFVSREELVSLYKTAQAVLYRHYNEGFGYIPLESLICKVPFITNPDDSIPEILGDAGVYYKDYSKYVKKVEEAIKNKERIMERIQKRKAWALIQFEPRKIVKEHIICLKNNQNPYK
jgi:glycosyltransferase involved in cell wall biosynthesis